MAHPEALSRHVVINIDDDDDDGATTGCCAVCMEPSPEWVAAGACGHREVCMSCAVRMRLFCDDHRCCICRAFFPAVFITKASNDGSRQPAVISQTTSPGFFSVIPAGVCCWYHAGMAAFFDDQEAYEAARKMCSTPPCPAPPGAGDNKNPRRRAPPADDSCSGPRFFMLYLAGMTLVGALFSIPIAAHYFKLWISRVAIVLAFGLASAVFACFTWKK